MDLIRTLSQCFGHEHHVLVPTRLDKVRTLCGREEVVERLGPDRAVGTGISRDEKRTDYESTKSIHLDKKSLSEATPDQQPRGK
jgi:hypothetical protein